MPTVLIIGATGRLGPRVVTAFRTNGWTVLTAARSSADRIGDASEPAGAEYLVSSARPDAVINLAALADVDVCERDPEAATRANVRIPALIAEAAGRHGAICVHLSTDQVYDGPGPHREDHPTAVNRYAATKLAGERLALEQGAIVLRTNFLGRSGDPRRPGFTDWVVSVLREQKPATFLTDVLFTPLHAATLADQLVRIASHPVPGLFNLGSVGGCSKADAARRIAAALSLSTANARDGRQADLTLTARRPTDMRMISDRAATTFGLALPTTLHELDRTAAEYQP